MAVATPVKPVKPAKSAALNAASGKASTAVALKKPSGTSLVSIKEQMAQQLAGLAGRIAPATGNMIRATQDKRIVLPDGTKLDSDGALAMVILDFVVAHNFYEEGFDKDNIVPPGCFAIGTDPRKMAPSANVPNKQSADCQQCPMNAWDSGKGGKGKACNNERLLAVLPADADEDTPIWLLKASKTAIKGFDSYVAGVARTFQTMPIGVVTTVRLNPNVGYPSFEFSDAQPNPNLGVHFARQAEATEMLNATRDVSGYVPASKTPPKKGVRR